MESNADQSNTTGRINDRELTTLARTNETPALQATDAIVTHVVNVLPSERKLQCECQKTEKLHQMKFKLRETFV